MKSYALRWPLLLALLLAPTSGCGLFGSDEAEEPAVVDPADPDALSGALTIPGGRQREGDPPPPSDAPEAPRIINSLETQTTSNGSTFNLPFIYVGVDDALEGVYLKIDGAKTFFQAPIGSLPKEDKTITIPVTVPTNVKEGGFCTSYSLYSAGGFVSNAATTCVQVLKLGSGALQVSLSWNTAGTDVDLWVTGPSGSRINFRNGGSPDAPEEGQLDRDDRDGFGPENVFWPSGTAPDGGYLVEVDYFDGAMPTDYVVTVSAPETSRQFTGTLQGSGDHHRVVLITKSGNRLQFSDPPAAKTAEATLQLEKPPAR